MKTNGIPQFIIAAPTSNSGKTTLTLGLLRALENRGLLTQSFKVGPDYIDLKFHKIANRKNGLNLDLFMMEASDIENTYAYHSQNKDVVCIEGVMGLFDGAQRDFGSTAHLSKVLNLPIVLVVNAKAVAYSVAPLLFGFKNFDLDVTLAGVIFNNVNTASHYQFLKDACEDVGILPLGYLPFVPEAEIPSRHLGLSIDALEQFDASIDLLAQAIEKTVAVDALLSHSRKEIRTVAEDFSKKNKNNLTFAVANDVAFNFSYLQNIVALEQLGTVVFFSPLFDEVLPQADLIYLPGGYPELYVEALSKNYLMLKSIKNYADSGGRIIAECGGMMYLGQSIIDKNGMAWMMSGVFDFSTSMESMKLNLGYRKVVFDDFELKGHEFHYSTLIFDKKYQNNVKVLNAREQEVETIVFRYKNVLASYIHYYFGKDELVKKILKELNLEIA